MFAWDVFIRYPFLLESFVDCKREKSQQPKITHETQNFYSDLKVRFWREKRTIRLIGISCATAKRDNKKNTWKTNVKWGRRGKKQHTHTYSVELDYKSPFYMCIQIKCRCNTRIIYAKVGFSTSKVHEKRDTGILVAKCAVRQGGDDSKN